MHRQSSPKLRVEHAISTAINRSLRGRKSGRQWESLVGFRLDELMSHLEALWLPGMNWQNYGFGAGKWHVDHKVPKSWFMYNSTSDPSFRECWSLSNLQPLWQADNCAKRDRFAHTD